MGRKASAKCSCAQWGAVLLGVQSFWLRRRNTRRQNWRAPRVRQETLLDAMLSWNKCLAQSRFKAL